MMDASKKSTTDGQIGLELLFKDVCVRAGDKQILKNVCGAVAAGHLMAVMGPSGGGKTTLLSTLSGRRDLEAGEVTLNGIPINKSLRRNICYVMQDDVFFPNLSLIETLTFTAMIRLPDTMKKSEKIERMNEVIDELDLRHCVNTAMGGMWVPGLSGGERKRASIACELITDPNLILLDEPTSGLDYKTAFSLVKTLKHYTEGRNKTVVATIHQPSSQIFYFFDLLLLMCDGNSVYYGSPQNVTAFFDKIGYPMPHRYNPADFILEKLKESPEVQKSIIESSYKERLTESWHVFLKSTSQSSNTESGHNNAGHRYKSGKTTLSWLPWKQREQQTLANEETGDVHVSLVNLNNGNEPKISSLYDKWPTGFLTQFSQLFVRSFNQSKTKMYSKFKIFETTFLCVLLSLIWFQLPKSENTLRDRMGVIFYISMHWGFTPLFDAVTSFPSEKMVIFKERASGWYRLSAYYLAKMMSELPLLLVQPVLFLAVVYWVVGLNGVGPFFATIGTIFVHAVAGQSIGLCFGIYCTDMRSGISSSTVMIMFIMLLGGFYSRHLPFWLDWVKYLAFLHYTFHCLMFLEFSGESTIKCAESTNSTQSQFEICQQSTTTIPNPELLNYYQINQPFWQYFLPLFAFLFVFRVLGYLLLRFYQKPH